MERVLLKKSVLLDDLERHSIEEEIEVPELAGKYGLPEDETPFLKIRGATLKDHLLCQDVHRIAAVMATKFLVQTSKKEFNLGEFLKSVEDPSSHKYLLELSLFKSNVIEPKFSTAEVTELANKCPEVVNRIVKRILSITSLES